MLDYGSLWSQSYLVEYPQIRFQDSCEWTSLWGGCQAGPSTHFGNHLADVYHVCGPVCSICVQVYLHYLVNAILIFSARPKKVRYYLNLYQQGKIWLAANN